MQHGTCAKKEEALKQGMIQHVEQSAGEPQHSEGGRSAAEANEPYPEAQGNDADVFHAAVGKEPFEIMLGERKEDAEDARRHANTAQDPAPPHRWRPDEREDADEPIDARLDHDAGHQSGDVGRRRRVCFRQPDVEWHEARLCAETNHREQEHHTRTSRGSKAVEIERTQEKTKIGSRKNADSASSAIKNDPYGTSQGR